MTVTLKDIKKAFPKESDCTELLEHIIWNGRIICPYCPPSAQVYKITIMNGRYHCNGCNSSFSVTVKTIFARTRCDLRKWFLSIYLLNIPSKISLRDLGEKISTTKDTANLISDKIRKAKIDTPEMLQKIIEEINKRLVK